MYYYCSSGEWVEWKSSKYSHCTENACVACEAQQAATIRWIERNPFYCVNVRTWLELAIMKIKKKQKRTIRPYIIPSRREWESERAKQMGHVGRCGIGFVVDHKAISVWLFSCLAAIYTKGSSRYYTYNCFRINIKYIIMEEIVFDDNDLIHEYECICIYDCIFNIILYYCNLHWM